MIKKSSHYLLFGPYQSGKDTFIYNLDQSTKGLLNISNPISDTKKCEWIPYSNPKINGNNEGFILNTIGWGTPYDFNDEQIAFNIIKKCIEKEEDINCFLLLQSLSEPYLLEKILKYIQVLFGKSAFESAVIIATKGNLVDKDDLDYRKMLLTDLADRFGVKGGIYELKGKYLILNKFKEEKVLCIEDSGAEKGNDFSILGEIISKLRTYQLDDLKKNLKIKQIITKKTALDIKQEEKNDGSNPKKKFDLKNFCKDKYNNLRNRFGSISSEETKNDKKITNENSEEIDEDERLKEAISDLLSTIRKKKKIETEKIIACDF